jgi:hypothetical protein
MNIAPERAIEILGILGKEALQYVNAEDLMDLFLGNESWEQHFRDFENGDGMTGILADIIGDSKITEEEFSEIVRPYIAERLADCLGASEVIIRWNTPTESSDVKE